MSTIANRNRSIRVFGDDGILEVDDCADDRSPVRWRRYLTVRRRLMYRPWPRRVALARSGSRRVRYRGAQRRDFARGIVEMAEAIREGRPPRLSAAFAAHTLDVLEAIDRSRAGPARATITSTFDPMPPMPWAA